jgi:hypothetical protein
MRELQQDIVQYLVLYVEENARTRAKAHKARITAYSLHNGLKLNESSIIYR